MTHTPQGHSTPHPQICHTLPPTHTPQSHSTPHPHTPAHRTLGPPTLLTPQSSSLYPPPTHPSHTLTPTHTPQSHSTPHPHTPVTLRRRLHSPPALYPPTTFHSVQVPVQYPYTLLVFVMLLSISLRPDTLWTLLDALFLGLLVALGRWGMTHALWTVVLLGVTLIFVAQFLLLLGVPPALQPYYPLYPNTAYACEYWTPAGYHYLQVCAGLRPPRSAFDSHRLCRWALWHSVCHAN